MDSDQIIQRLTEKVSRGIFGDNLIENSFRGYWAEYMVAEAIGANCKIVSHGWHAWDLQIGPSEAEFPERIRIQVKNTARIQTWHVPGQKLTECSWQLPMGRKPFYFDSYNPNVPCEPHGHLCDVYVLCHHPIEDAALVDHRDPYQWKFYIVPVTPNRTNYPVKEWPPDQKKAPAYTVVPESLSKGIRGRPPINPLNFDELSENAVRDALGIS